LSWAAVMVYTYSKVMSEQPVHERAYACIFPQRRGSRPSYATHLSLSTNEQRRHNPPPARKHRSRSLLAAVSPKRGVSDSMPTILARSTAIRRTSEQAR
jgi:hypothetical protein